jgi:hypothetical protein
VRRKINSELLPKKVGCYLKIWLSVVLWTTAVSCVKPIDETNSNIALINATKTSFASESTKSRLPRTIFERNLPADFEIPSADDAVKNRLLKDYGAMFVARGGVVPPPKIIFANHEECAAWQSQISTRKEIFGGITVELQTPAMQALINARDELRASNLTITARGMWAARRDYEDTVEIWQTRVKPGLNYWVNRGRLSRAEAERIRQLAPAEQVAEILRLEERGMFFSKGFSKSILYSATAPGASQHLSMLAFDANEHGNSKIRAVLAKHGWFQTVAGDAPHFTFLGAPEAELPSRGLKRTVRDNRVFWIPD